MSFHGTSAALAALILAACASTTPPVEVSQGASAVQVAEAEAPAPGTPEFHGADIGRDALRSRIRD